PRKLSTTPDLVDTIIVFQADCFHVMNPATAYNPKIMRLGVDHIKDDIDCGWPRGNRQDDLPYSLFFRTIKSTDIGVALNDLIGQSHLVDNALKEDLDAYHNLRMISRAVDCLTQAEFGVFVLRFNFKVVELRECYFCLFPYDVVLLEWSLKLGGLDDEGKASSGDRKLLEKQQERSISAKHLGKAEDRGSFSIEETSSSGRDDDCRGMEETINKIEVTVGIEAGERSEVDKDIKEDNTKVKDKLLFIYPEGIDVGKEFMKYKKKLKGEWGNYVMEEGIQRDKRVDSRVPKVQRAHKSRTMDEKKKARLSVSDLTSHPLPELESTNVTWSLWRLKKPASEASIFIVGVAPEKEVDKPFNGGVVEELVFSMLMKGATNFIVKRNQEFIELTRRLDAQMSRMKELKEELEIEKKSRVKDLKSAEERQDWLRSPIPEEISAEEKLENLEEIEKGTNIAPNEEVAIKLEVKRLRKTISDLERSLSRARDSVAHIQQDRRSMRIVFFEDKKRANSGSTEIRG
ncbi:hypothetical protein GIB67_013580, partial [Kingdonia uniflora]